MEKMTRLSAQQRADLVAYLDGELDDVTMKDIEQTLTKSPAARHDVDMLIRTWDLLDELGRTTASQDFSNKTMTNLRAAETQAPWTGGTWIEFLRGAGARHGAILVGWVAGLACIAIVGFLLTNHWIPDESRMLVEELPVIENLDRYSNIGSIEFLRELNSKVGKFDENPNAPRK